MADPIETRDDDAPRAKATDAAQPGLVVIFAEGTPRLDVYPIVRGVLKLGREGGGDFPLADSVVSREHAVVSHDGARFTVVDRGSRNGTYVDGARIDSHIVEQSAVLRVGQTICLLLPEVRRFQRGRVERRDGLVIGPTLREALDRVALAARAGETLHVTGESGSGKELAARTFHEAGPRAAGPFVAVNCAAIPEGVAERLLFGARKGAYSGATADADGYVQSADKGTLFLDEIAELEEAVQAKLLRVLETREVLPLGASRARPVQLGVVSATNADLATEVAADRFREDLYFRIGRPAVHVPPLRERREELPWLIAAALHRVRDDLTPTARLVELCCLRPWPGNVRELLRELPNAAHEAIGADRSVVSEEDLATDAGVALGDREPHRAGARSRAATPLPVGPDAAAITAALADNGGNVSAAARALGLHRTQLRRLIKRFGLSVAESGED